MNCKDFKEIADSYLSNELLVETNHEVYRHLENCSACRHDLGARRELRNRLRTAVKNSEDNQINPFFARKLTTSLRESALPKRKSASLFSMRSVFASLVAVLMLSVGIFVFWRSGSTHETVENKPNVELLNENSTLLKHVSFAALQQDAVDDHKDCAIAHRLKEMPISLDKAAEIHDAANKNFDAAVMKPLKEIFGDKIKLLGAHSCLINGTRFAHIIVEYQNKTVSVLLTKSEDEYTVETGDGVCKSNKEFRVACFKNGSYRIFVVSDLDEKNNTLIADSILPAVNEHIKKNKQNA